MSLHINNLHIETAGQGEELVLLHGWGMHSGIWQDVLPQLCQRYRVHAVDLPGMGLSTAIHPYTLETIVARIAEEFDHPVTLCGWSLGGQIAMHWSLSRPQQIEKLVLVGSTPCFVSNDSWPHGVAAEVFRQFASQVGADYRNTLIRFLSLQAQGGDSSREHIRQLRERFFQYPAPATNVLQAGLEILLQTDLREQMHTLQQATLLIHGTRDTLAPAAAARWLAKVLPSAQLCLLEKASHAPFLSHPSEFMSAISAFMEAP